MLVLSWNWRQLLPFHPITRAIIIHAITIIIIRYFNISLLLSIMWAYTAHTMDLLAFFWQMLHVSQVTQHSRSRLLLCHNRLNWGRLLRNIMASCCCCCCEKETATQVTQELLSSCGFVSRDKSTQQRFKATITWIEHQFYRLFFRLQRGHFSVAIGKLGKMVTSIQSFYTFWPQFAISSVTHKRASETQTNNDRISALELMRDDFHSFEMTPQSA